MDSTDQECAGCIRLQKVIDGLLDRLQVAGGSTGSPSPELGGPSIFDSLADQIEGQNAAEGDEDLVLSDSETIKAFREVHIVGPYDGCKIISESEEEEEATDAA